MKLIVTAFLAIFLLRNPADLASAVTQRLDSFNALPGNPIEYRLQGQTAGETSAILYLQPFSHAIQSASTFTPNAPYPGIVDWGVAIKSGSAWTIYLPGDSGYTAAFDDDLTPDVLLRADSSPYTLHADPALAGDLSGYQFPWDDGAWATVTRSYHVHGIGRIDFDISGRDVAAAKDGIIVYANDTHTSNAYASAAWWYWNTVIIQHGDHQFSLYGHLAPGSIPAWIKQGCSPDITAPNCHVPVKAGQIIALEGSTGYSSNPHLHLEFGQAFGVAAYMDTADDDRDGNRAKPVYAGYIYAEQNVGISGSTPDQVASWAFGTLEQARHGATPQPNINLLQNGDFSAGMESWTPSGQLNWSVQDGVLRFLRLRTSARTDWAAFYQDVSGVDANTPLEAALRLGSASSLAKTVTISIFNRSGKQYGSLDCVFSLAPNAPLALYTLRGVIVSTAANLRFEIAVNPPDGSPAVLADDISLQVRSNSTENQCITPP